MSLRPRVSVASLICPSAPFLVPRLIKCPFATPDFQALAQRRAIRIHKKPGALRINKHVVDRISRRAAVNQTDAAAAEEDWIEKQFYEACNRRNIEDVEKIYPRALQTVSLSRSHTYALAEALHNALRNYKSGSHGPQKILHFVARVVQDIRSGLLAASPSAYVHILGIFKRSKKFEEGADFWQWLLRRDDSYVNAAVYGAALELLAVQGNTRLVDMELLYEDALKRFPGTFAEYHFSPDAIVPDRTQRISISGLPVGLLQGILTARMYARDWKRSYLALDTALRLYPTQTPARFFELFIYARPIGEAYTVFMLACRSGKSPRADLLTTILNELSNAMKTSTTLEARLIFLRAMADALYAYLEGRGTITGPHIGCFLNGFTGLLAKRTALAGFEGDEHLMRDTLVTTAHEISATLFQSGMEPYPAVFAALLHLAGQCRVPGLLESTISDVQKLRVDIGPIGRRNALLAAGSIGNPDLVKQLWVDITSRAETEGSQVEYNDWVTLARACNRSQCEYYLNQEMENLSHTLTDRVRFRIQRVAAEQPVAETLEHVKLVEMAAFNKVMEGISARMRDSAAVLMSGQPLNFNNTPFSVFLDPERKQIASMAEMRAVYNGFTTDPHQPPPPLTNASRDVRKNSIGIPFDELRFQNWVAILELMNEADATEVEFQKHVDEAIASGRPLNKMPFVMRPRGPAPLEPDSALGQPVDVAQRREKLRAKIQELRTPPALA